QVSPRRRHSAFATPGCAGPNTSRRFARTRSNIWFRLALDRDLAARVDDEGAQVDRYRFAVDVDRDREQVAPGRERQRVPAPEARAVTPAAQPDLECFELKWLSVVHRDQ